MLCAGWATRLSPCGTTARPGRGTADAEFAAAHGFAYARRIADAVGGTARLPSGYRFLCRTGTAPEERAARTRSAQQAITGRGGTMLTMRAVGKLLGHRPERSVGIRQLRP